MRLIEHFFIRLRRSLSEYNLNIFPSLLFHNISSNEIIISAIPRERRKLDGEIGDLSTKFKPLLVVPLLLWHLFVFWGGAESRRFGITFLDRQILLICTPCRRLSPSPSLSFSFSLYLSLSLPTFFPACIVT